MEAEPRAPRKRRWRRRVVIALLSLLGVITLLVGGLVG
jgi:hypothetical protein